MNNINTKNTDGFQLRLVDLATSDDPIQKRQSPITPAGDAHADWEAAERALEKALTALRDGRTLHEGTLARDGVLAKVTEAKAAVQRAERDLETLCAMIEDNA